jgi:tetraacyldisaccharide 4'-kinase
VRVPHEPGHIALLLLPAAAYGGAVRLRNRYYDQKSSAMRASLPVLSVGNLTVGGTGKTTIVAWLVRRLQEWGHCPAVVSRGYGGKAGRGPLVVSNGGEPLVGPDRCGDEPYLLAKSLHGAKVVVGSDRHAGADAARAMGADVVVLDDGFQHRRLARDLDLVLLDAAGPFGNYHLLPAGSLREPISGLKRADVVLITRSRPAESFVVLERVVRRYNATCPILRSSHHRLGFFDVAGTRVARPPKAVAFCGIGNPASFLSDIEAEGVEVVAFRPFPDHHPFSAEEWRELVRSADEHDAALVTTEKDLARLSSSPAAAAFGRLCSLRIEAMIHDADILLDAVRTALARGRT